MNEVIQDGSQFSPLLASQKRHHRGQAIIGQRPEEFQINVFDDLPQLQQIQSSISARESWQSISRISPGRQKPQTSKLRKSAESGLEFKSNISRVDTIKIVTYHLIEPFLLGSLIGTSLQISQFSTIVYLAICLFIVMPFVLTSDLQKVKVKLGLISFIIALSATVLMFKTWVYLQFTETLNVDQNLQEFFGIFQAQAAKTFTIDSIICSISALLVWHYSSQLHQIQNRAQTKSTLKYQTSIKFLHIIFGDSITLIYITTFALFTIDTLMFQTVITFLITLAQLCLLYFWAYGKQEFVLPAKSLDYSIRAMQVLTIISLVFTFCLNFNFLLTEWSWLQEHPSLLQLIGIETITIQGDWLFRANEVILSFAIVMTQVYFVVRGIKEEAKITAFNRGDSLRGSQRVSNKNQHLDKFRKWWEYAKIEVALWLCRAFCLLQTYMYHDYQSLVPLIWVLSSTLYKRSKVFVRITVWFFLPLMISQYLFYFAVNVNGLINYSEWSSEEIISWYKYGFYQMKLPYVQFGFLFVTMFTMALYTRLVFQRDAKEREQESQMWSLSKDTLYQLYYLFVLYIKYPILLVLVFSGFIKMDFYHVSLLCIFVWAAMYPAQFQKHVFWILLYSDFWLLAKYVYTLIIAEAETMANPTWFTLIGIATAYDPKQSKEYFRYRMKLDQWLLVLLIFAQYRRSNVLGTDYKQILKTERNVLNSLSVKFPLLFKLQKYLSIILNQTIVIISFLAYILIITFTQRSLINLVTFLMILCLLCVYLLFGLNRLLKVWNITTSYTALVLVSQLGYQFAATAQMENFITGDLTLRQQAYINWIGFQVFNTETMWMEFVPYVFMFFMSVVLKQAFINKDQREKKDLLLAAQEIQDEKSDSSQEYITDIERKRLEIENLHYGMQYKLSYLLWKVKPLWPVFDQIALYWHLLSATIVLTFAVYYQVALLWLAFIILYMAQTCKVHHDHLRYKLEQIRRFKDSGTEVDGMELQLRQYANSSKDTRRQKLLDQSGDVVTKLLKQPVFDQKGQLDKRLLVSDEEAMSELQQYKNEAYAVTLKSRKQFWTVQYILLVIAFGLVYSTEFLTVKYPESAEVQVMLIENLELQNLLVFIAFWSGVYKGDNKQLSNKLTLVTEYYPLYIYLLLLITEKLCQIWLQDKFKTTDEKVTIFEQTEREYKEAIGELPLRPSQNVSILMISESSSEQQIDTRLIIQPIIQPQKQQSQQVDEKQTAFKQIGVLLAVKPHLVYYKAFQTVTKELVIMLVWFSIIYKQNILSFVLFIVLLIHTYNHMFPYINTFTFVRNTIFGVFIAQYVLQVLCLSSYNSPAPFPSQLGSVYPGQNYFLSVPVYFNLSFISSNNIVQLPWSNFFALQAGSQKLNGIWIDFCVTILLFIQLNCFNFWLLDEPHKIFPSKLTKELVKQYSDTKSVDAVRKELLHEQPTYRVLQSFCTFLYTNFALLMIMFTLFISIFNKSLLSFGYFVFCMVLIFNLRRFFKDPKGYSNQIAILQWLVPYLLIDILLQVFYQVPFQETQVSNNFQSFLQKVGFIKVWSTYPKQISFGQGQLVISEFLNIGVAALFLKGFTYFMVMLQLQVLKSTGFRRFNDYTLINMKKHTDLIGRGMAYRQNNFVSQKVLEQADDYGKLEKMLKHVKTLIRDRDKFNFNEGQAVCVKQTEYNNEIEKEYNRRLQNLSWPHKLYLWMRKHFVLDIMFKHSDDHLVDMVEQYRAGRTSIKTQIEVGLMNDVRQEQAVTLKKSQVEQLDLSKPKPWEQLQPDYLTYKKLCVYYLSLLWKIIVSHTHLLCFFFMLLAAISNGGFIYMVYPCMIFGNAFIEEQRPGKRFWYFVIIYTQIIIILQFFIQLNFWSVQDDRSFTNALYLWQKRKNLGFVHIPKDEYGFGAVLKTFYAELLVLSTVLVHITQDTLSGLFNVRVQNYESFEDGLDRYIKIALKGSQLEQYLKVYQANLLNKELNYDKALVTKRRNSAPEVVAIDQQWFMDLDTEILKLGVNNVEQEREKSEFNHKMEKLELHAAELSKVQKIKLIFWDSPFFIRLFPTVRQKKPGKDLYMWVTGLSIVMIVYIFIWYSQLAMKETTIAEQIQTSQLQTPMVVSVLVIMGFMVLDRIFYSTYVFASLKVVTKKLDTKGPLLDTSPSNASKQAVNSAYFESLVPQYSLHSPYRVIKYYYIWVLIIISHFYVFFFLAKQRLCPTQDPFCNKIGRNPTLLVFYFILCVYLWLQAHQIRVGLPELKQGGFMMGSYNFYSKTIFQIWYYIPFLFELRTIIDWTFSKTSLDVFQSIKLAQIQSDLYLAKCMNQGYRSRELGQQVEWYYKAGIGGLLLVFVLGLIIVPMILFSALNPVAVPNPIIEGSLSFQLAINNQSQSIQIPLFQTTQVLELQTLSTQQFANFGFEDSSQTNQFKPDQAQSIQFSPVSDTIWVVAPPKIQYLIRVLTDAINNVGDKATVRAEMNFDLIRSHQNEVVRSKMQMPLNSGTPDILYNLTQMIQCNSSVTEVVFPPQINLLLLLQSKLTTASFITNPKIVSGATLSYQCNPNQSNYWTLTQNWDLNSKQAELIKILPEDGFGIFVFNQTLLPPALAAYASSILIFYATLVYIIASAFRNGFVPKSYQIFVIDAIHTEDIIMICQCIYIYRVQKNLKNEEELYMILIDIMRSPETLKSLTGSSLKKKLD